MSIREIPSLDKNGLNWLRVTFNASFRATDPSAYTPGESHDVLSRPHSRAGVNNKRKFIPFFRYAITELRFYEVTL